MYNDVASWRHLQALSFFGDDEEHAEEITLMSGTWGELGFALETVRAGVMGVRLVEVCMGREDCQGALLELLEMQIALGGSVDG